MPRRALGLALLLAGCAAPQWAKEGASAEQLERDLKECQDAAFKEVNSRPHGYATMGPAVLAPPSERRLNAYPGTFADPHGDRFAEELRLENDCMRSRGYQQAPRRKG